MSRYYHSRHKCFHNAVGNCDGSETKQGMHRCEIGRYLAMQIIRQELTCAECLQCLSPKTPADAMDLHITASFIRYVTKSLSAMPHQLSYTVNTNYSACFSEADLMNYQCNKATDFTVDQFFCPSVEYA